MIPTYRLIALLCLGSASGFGESWSGILVDSKCYESEERNLNPFEIEGAHDRGMEIRACHPGLRTKLFALVDDEGQIFRLDPVGNAKAAELSRTADKKHAIAVAVTGERSKNTLKVDSIAVVK